MATKTKTAEPPVRKSFIVGGGIVIGVAILAFILNTFVLNGGGGGGDIPLPSGVPNPTTAPATGVPGSDNNPVTDGTTDTGGFPKNDLTPGGRNPFTKQAAGSSGSKVQAASAAPETTVKTHAWQVLELKDGEATFLVDGKKKIVGVGDALVDGYKFNSITGKCVTVKGEKTFGLCPGAAPFVF